MRQVWMCVMWAGVVFGCNEAFPPVRSASPGTPTPASGPAPAVMAYVGGQPIYMSELNDLLVRSYGLPMAYQLIASELVIQAAEAKGITVTDREVQEEHDRTVTEMFSQADRSEQREQLLNELLRQRNMSYRQWQMVMRRNALLRKLVEPRVTVTPEDVAKEFAVQYGQKIQVRHIQVTSLAAADDVRKQLKDGADFAELARRVSVNPSAAEGGLLPPIGRDSTNLPPAIVEAAMSLKQVGQITDPIQVDTAFHILKLEKIIEPQNVKLDDVKDKLTQNLRNRRLRIESQKLLQELIQAAKDGKSIQYADPVLKAQFQAALEQAKQQ